MSDSFDKQRRQFLTGGMLSRPASTSGESLFALPLDRAASHFERYTKAAMACDFELLTNLHQFPNTAESALRAFAILDSIEDQMSIYRDSSELSKLNVAASKQPVQADERLFEVLKLAEEIHHSTSGAFDITAHPLSQVWGFSQRQGSVPDQTDIEAALERVGMEHVELKADARSVSFNKDGIGIDLGGIGKGFAIDLATKSLLKDGINDFVIHGGQSSVAAAGRNIGLDSENGVGWRIGLSHPTTPDCRLAEFELADQFLGTSGTQRQGFFYRGKRYGHIIDPRTGFPTDHCLSSTVICNSAALADALATAFFVMPLNEVQEFCDQNPHVAAILIYPNENLTIQLETFNCDSLVWRKLI